MATSRLSTRRVDWRVQVGTSNKAAQGLVIFEASVSYIPDPLAAGGPRTAIPEPVAAVLDGSGYACTPAAGNPSAPGERGVPLFTTDSLGEDGGDWTWTARPQLRSVNGIQIANAVPAFSFAVPAGAGSLDLATVQKVPASPGLGTEQAVALVARAEKAAQDAFTAVKNTVDAAAAEAVSNEIGARDLVEGSDPRVPEHQPISGLSIAMTDERGARTRLEANDIDGGPTPHSLSLDGPALKEHMDFITGDDHRVPTTEAVPGVSLAMVDAGGRLLWMQANDTDGGPTPYTLDILRDALALPEDGNATPPIFTEGDSITAGTYGGGSTWQTHLSALLDGRPVLNLGMHGTTATEIGIRHGGITPLVTVTDGQLPAGTTPVAVTLDNLPSNASFWSSATQPARTYRGTFDGVPATLSKTQENTWTLHRLAAGAAPLVTVPATQFLLSDIPAPDSVRIIWPGRNDYPKTQVREPIDRMARWSADHNGRFLVASILTRAQQTAAGGDYLEVIEQNRLSAIAYPRNYVNVRGYMIRRGLSVAGVTPTQADLNAVAADAIPPSLMADDLHPNEAGRRAIAQCFADALKIRNWV